MTTPREVVEPFLREKTVAWAAARPHLEALHTKYFGEPLLQRAEQFMPHDVVRAVVEAERHSDIVASVVTRQQFTTADIRTRYRLAAVGESWKIVGIDRECFCCRGTGQTGGARCQQCDGEGWHDQTRRMA